MILQKTAVQYIRYHSTITGRLSAPITVTDDLSEADLTFPNELF